MHKASTISDFFIAFSHQYGDPLSNLKLQKLLYYAQAWHLAIFDQPLFEESIEAWVHGPVVASEYRRFKGWAWQPIQDNPEMPTLGEAVEEHLSDVVNVYGGMTAYQLEQLTHSEAPWINARNGVPEDEPSSAVISHERMKDFYRTRMNG
jgi:uncharacterized phage-associated protein